MPASGINSGNRTAQWEADMRAAEQSGTQPGRALSPRPLHPTTPTPCTYGRTARHPLKTAGCAVALGATSVC